jgi:hypothetical protein
LSVAVVGGDLAAPAGGEQAVAAVHLGGQLGGQLGEGAQR